MAEVKGWNVFQGQRIKNNNNKGWGRYNNLGDQLGVSPTIYAKSTKASITYINEPASLTSNFPTIINPYYKPESIPKPNIVSNLLVEEIQYYVRYAGASYCTIHSARNKLCSYCKEFEKGTVIFPITNETSNLQAIITPLTEHRVVVLAYRGSDCISKLIGSMSTDTVDYPGVGDAKVNQYFYDSVKSLQPSLEKKLSFLLAHYPDFRLVITGHSLGGALATLAAPLIHDELSIPYSRMRIITYGQLRVGNLDFVEWYNQLKLNFTRVVNGKDEAANTPNFSLDWVHVNYEVHIVDNKYYDCGSTRIEHPHCSFGKTAYLGVLTDHEKVGDTKLSPTQCDDWPHYLKKEFYNR